MLLGVVFGSFYCFNVSSDNGRLDFQGLVLVVFKEIGKKKLTDIGFFWFWLSKGLWIVVFKRIGLLLDIGFGFLSDIGLIDYVSINF